MLGIKLGLMALYVAIGLPGWLAGLLAGKIGAIVVGYVVRPLMDSLKRASLWLDTQSSGVKQLVVLLLSVVVAVGLHALSYAVPGCSLDTLEGCNPLSWSQAIWTGVLGALVAFLLKAAKQSSEAKADARSAMRVSTDTRAQVATAVASLPTGTDRTPFTSPTK